MHAVSRQELAAIIAERTLHVTDKAELARQIAGYLESETRNYDFNSLMRDVMQYRLEKGYVEAVAFSAHDLPQQVLDDIVELLKDHYPLAKHIRVDGVRDESLVGGIRIELPLETLDLSIKAKLNQFKRLVASERT